MRTALRFSMASAALLGLLVTSSAALAQTGGGGGGGSGGGGGGGGGGGSGGGGSGSSGSSGVGSSTSGSIDTSSLLGSFDNIGRARSGTLSTSNMFSSYYYNPYAQGLLTQNGQNFTPITNAGFGQALFNSTTSGSSGSRSVGGTNGFGSTSGNRGGTSGSSFGGTSVGGVSNFGSSGGGTFGGSTGFGGGASSLGGTAGLRSGSTSGMTFPGGAFGPSIGRTGPIIGSMLHFAASPTIETDRRANVQDLVSRTTAIASPAGVNAALNSGVLHLRGTVQTAAERQLLENMMRLQPGVREIRNELEVRGGGQ